VLLIYNHKTCRVTRIVESGKSLVGDRGNKIIYVKRKRFIVIWDMDISSQSTRSGWGSSIILQQWLQQQQR